MDNINIEDQSGDKKYFTQIPNMIVNHSTAYEQSLYLTMKRFAGEKGSCYASLNSLSKKMGVDKKTVAKNIEKLLKRGWIKEVDSKQVRGGIVRQFIMVDLWKLNMEMYESVGSGVSITTKGSGGVVQESGSIIPESGVHVDTKKNEEDILKKNIYPFLKDKKFTETFNDFELMRKSIKKPMSLRAREIILSKLSQHDPKVAIRMLENSIEHNWLSVFPLKAEEIASMSMPTYPKFVKPNVGNLNRLEAMKSGVLKSF